MKPNQSFKYSILLVDDHQLLRRAVRRVIEANPELAVIAELSDGQDLMKFLEKSSAQMIVLDISLPHMSGIEATRRIKREHPDVKVLILTIHDNEEYMEQARTFGAEGYLLKEDIGDELLPAITSLRRGGTYFSSQLSA